MAEHTSKSIFHYQIDPLIKPGANLSVWVWLGLLGIPALLLMLVYSKVEDRQTAPAARPAATAEPLPPVRTPRSPAH